MTEAMVPAASTADARAILIAARGLISDPAHWCTGTWARTETYMDVRPLSRNAVKWCAAGAVWRVADSMPGPVFCLAFDQATLAARAAGWDSLSEANDRLSHAGVLAILDAALASLAELCHD